MKKNLRKLTLARETVRSLEAVQTAGGTLPQTGGPTPTGGPTEVYSCTGASGCYSMEHSCESLCPC